MNAREWAVGDADWSGRGFARYELIGVCTVSKSDADLISAAPDLLEACRAALVTLVWSDGSRRCDCDDCTAAIDKLRAALAKAERVTPAIPLDEPGPTGEPNITGLANSLSSNSAGDDTGAGRAILAPVKSQR